MKREFEAGIKSGITPDPSWIRKHDEIVMNVFKRNRKMVLRTLFFLLLTVAAAIWVNVVLAVVLGLVTAFNLFLLVAAGQRMPSSFLKEIYQEGLLTPGMIVKTQPLTIAALANLATDEELEPRYGCFFQEVGRLPGMRGELYEKLPCSSMFRYSGGDYHSAFQPHPICWATADEQQIQAALEALERDMQEEGTDQWPIIRQTAEQFPNIKNEFIVELDKDFQPVGLKHYQDNEFKPYAAGAASGSYEKMPQIVSHLPEDLPAMVQFNKLADLAQEHLAYDYISQSCNYGDLPYRDNPGFYTYFSDGAGFLKAEQKRKLALEEGETPLLGGDTLITTRGGWQKKAFIPWKDIRFEVSLNGDGDIEVRVNGNLTAVMPCHVDEYTGHDAFGDEDRAAVRELERQRMQEFLEALKAYWEEKAL